MLFPIINRHAQIGSSRSLDILDQWAIIHRLPASTDSRIRSQEYVTRGTMSVGIRPTPRATHTTRDNSILGRHKIRDKALRAELGNLHTLDWPRLGSGVGSVPIPQWTGTEAFGVHSARSSFGFATELAALFALSVNGM